MPTVYRRISRYKVVISFPVPCSCIKSVFRAWPNVSHPSFIHHLEHIMLMSAITKREEDTVSNHLGAIIGISPLPAMGYELISRFMCGSSCNYCFDHYHYCFVGQEEESE